MRLRFISADGRQNEHATTLDVAQMPTELVWVRPEVRNGQPEEPRPFRFDHVAPDGAYVYREGRAP